ncbi:MAG: spore coat associated protein CotJA [Oscillospiraceae bacterium]
MNNNIYENSTKLPTTRLPENIPLASSFVPYQFWDTPMPPKESLKIGTIFSELDFPFIGDGGAESD